MDIEFTAIPPMMLQPFAENSIIHGMKNIDKKGKITVSFKKIDNYLQCEVIDNGVGREQAAKNKSQLTNYHKSTALIVTQERLAILNTDIKAKGIEINDRFDENNNCSGTQVILRVPFMELDF